MTKANAANAIKVPTPGFLLIFVLGCLGMLGFAEIIQAEDYSPPARHSFPTQVFWGDTHLHTNLSPDAFSFGNRTLGPEQAYRFARGEVVTSQTGLKAKLSRPLDFLMVSDHSEFLGIFPKVFSGSEDIMQTPLGKRWKSYIDANRLDRVLAEFSFFGMNISESDELDSRLKFLFRDFSPEEMQSLRAIKEPVPAALKQSIWDQVGKVADAFYEPGKFTTFIGYEWTSMPDGNNLHRNVLFRDSSDKTSLVAPFSSIDSVDPEDLWDYMADYEKSTGGQVLAIPHNGNLSNGLMFAETTMDGKPLSRDYAERRSRWEPLIEVTQIKGDGEAHPFLSPNDEFADYETWDKANLSMTVPKKNAMLQHEYARSALKLGLAVGNDLGANPFEFGMIGSTDSHTSLATGDEDNFFGKMTASEPSKDRAQLNFVESMDEQQLSLKHWETLASGYAAVWATENTREALFDAMRRKETYATTGPRLLVRFFGGWDFEQGDEQRPDFAQYAYTKGVPMGGHLSASKNKQSPRFIISAMKDPLGANLDRLQIVKGWMDAKGETHEKVYNVAVSDGRKVKRNKVQPVGNTVDIEQATYRNTIGDAMLSTVWHDPDFNPEQPTFYYVRVLEIPTPRWTAYDAKRFAARLDKKIPAYGQERAYTSPIWYEPDVRP